MPRTTIRALAALAPCAVALLVAPPAVAKEWNKIQPGQSNESTVLAQFGEPKLRTARDGKKVLSYAGDRAIKGTTQANFYVDASNAVEEIHVFPTRKLDPKTVERAFGPACTERKDIACFHQRLTDDFRSYWWYPTLGLVVFYGEDGQSVESFIYARPESAATPGTAR